jgi:hypothetical protein
MTCLGEPGSVTVVTDGTTSTSVRISQLVEKPSYSRMPIVVVWDNGRSAFLGEHSCMDGTPTLRLNEFILGSLAAKEIDLGSSITELLAHSSRRNRLDSQRRRSCRRERSGEELRQARRRA